jgi:ATP-dependent DNA helicase DinG
VINKSDWIRFFPYPECRKSQEDAINSALNAFLNENKRFVIIEAATGTGKSAIGFTIAKYMDSVLSESESFKKGSYFLTTQKLLQDQYMRDFGEPLSSMCQIMSATNYQCKHHKKQSCAESIQQLKTETDTTSKFYKTCKFNCTYRNEKNRFIASHESLTNFSYFLTGTAYTTTLPSRNLLVIDEAHNADGELCKFVEISVSERFASSGLKLEMPEVNTQIRAFEWIKDVYVPHLKIHVAHYESTIEKLNLQDKIANDFIKIAKQFDMLEKHLSKLEQFLSLYDKENWVFNLNEGEGKSMRKIEFKPIDISPYAEQMLFKSGKHVLLMSATIINHEGFSKMLGINDDNSSFMSIPSPFPHENHPIFSFPIAKMSSSTIDADLPKLAEAIKSILDQHPDEKGMIHTHSYKVASYIKNNVKNKRLIFHNAEDRTKKLEEHIRSKQPTVLVSPSMQEGVDLKDDLSRFQVICKVPYPYLGDKIVKKRMNKWQWWYSFETAKTVIQSLGRSIRTETDHAVSYILDVDWIRFYSNNSDLFPESFKKSIK